jgi:hypothetical protein
MKDAKGHGSDSRGGFHTRRGGYMGVPKPRVAAHQTGILGRIMNKVDAFAQDEHGGGYSPSHMFEHAVNPDTYTHIQHLTELLGHVVSSMALLAVLSILARSLGC